MTKWLELSLLTKPTLWGTTELVSVYESHRENDKAIAAWQRLVEATEENNPDHWWALGHIAELRNDQRSAARFYQEAASRVQDPFPYLYRLGFMLGWVGDDQGAEAAYRAAIKNLS